MPTRGAGKRKPARAGEPLGAGASLRAGVPNGSYRVRYFMTGNRGPTGVGIGVGGGFIRQ